MVKTKTALLLLSLLYFGIQPRSLQAQEEPEPEESIYVKALSQYVRWVKKFEPATDTLYFEELRGITTLFPETMDDLPIKILTGRNQRQIYTSKDGKLVQRKMTPARVNQAEIEVGIIPYQGKLDPQRGVILSLSKWHAVIFTYNPKTERFEYARFENR